MSADRRRNVALLAVVLALVIGFGAWFSLFKGDGSERVAAPHSPAEVVQPGTPSAPALTPDQQQSAAEGDAPAAPETAEATGDAGTAGEPEQADRTGQELAGQEQANSGADVAALDPSAAPESPDAARENPLATKPVFDIVRVEPTGDAVIAGRGAAGAAVELVRNGVVHDRVVADASGAFAFVPPPLPAGASELVLRVVGPDGTQVQSEQSVTVVVADDLTETPMVALAAPDQPTRVLSRPDAPGGATPVSDAEPATVAEVPAVEPESSEETSEASVQDAPVEVAAVDAAEIAADRPTIRIASVEAETGGGLYVSGEAAPSASVRLYLNDTFIAPAEASATGAVSFAIERGVRPGSYRIRLDEVTPETGAVLSRAEIQFEVPEMIAGAVETLPQAAEDAAVAGAPVEPPAAGSPSPEAGQVASANEPQAPAERPATTIIPEISTAVVTRGDSLWRISRQVYGSGIRYTEIFEANQNQIRNPDLIYPGQLFVLPADPLAADEPEN